MVSDVTVLRYVVAVFTALVSSVTIDCLVTMFILVPKATDVPIPPSLLTRACCCGQTSCPEVFRSADILTEIEPLQLAF